MWTKTSFRIWKTLEQFLFSSFRSRTNTEILLQTWYQAEENASPNKSKNNLHKIVWREFNVQKNIIRSKKQSILYNVERINKGVLESFMITLVYQCKWINNLSQLSALLGVLRMDRMLLGSQEPLWTEAATKAPLQLYGKKNENILIMLQPLRIYW